MTPEQIKSTRKQLGLTQEAFGKALGRSRIAINTWERGKFRAPSDLANQIANIFDITIAPGELVSPAVLAYRNARVIFQEHSKALQLANRTLFERNVPGFTRDDMTILFAEFPDILNGETK